MTDLRYFSLGRHAMKVALELAGVKTGDLVMLPSFICRDLLSSIKSLGALPVFYEVDINLNPVMLDSSRHPRAIIAVNYFGFAQNLEPFEKFSAETGAIVIEDNAHGFLSRDSKNSKLGQRTSLGITSFRKTLHVVDGATLAISLVSSEIPKQIDYLNSSSGLRTNFLHLLLRLERKTGVQMVGIAQSLSRLIRFVRTGSSLPTSDEEIEITIPGNANPHAISVSRMIETNEDLEVERRRSLYKQLLPEVLKLNLKPIFENLPAGTSPYGLPLYAPPHLKRNLSKLARRYRVTLMTWPDLPQEILPTAREHYKQVWLLNFR